MQAESKDIKVAVGMSGGVDSSAAAALLVDQGYEVIGLTAHMWSASRCCSVEDVQRAARVCSAMGIPHEVVNAVEEFGRAIVEPFVEEYARGRTPSPCVICNEKIKFGMALQKAMELGCAYFATGHYARVEKEDDGCHLFRGRDREKDQSYFLHRLSQDQLSRTLLPLGNMTKTEVSDYVKRKGVPVTFRSESQDLCFVPDDGHAAFVEEYRRDLKKRGEIVDARGQVLGEHEGFYRFTIGQRKGLGVASTEPLYVKELRAEENVVVVGPREEVMDDTCVVEHSHWISGRPPADAIACRVRVRYRHEAAPATLAPAGENTVTVRFEEPQFAITPGQAAVFYDGDEVLGGGWIGGNG